MRRIFVFLLTLFMPCVSMALVGNIDHREYVNWSSPEYSNIVYFRDYPYICTAQYVYYDIILTARHCVVHERTHDKYVNIGKQYEIILNDGRKTRVYLEKYGYDTETADWALLRVMDKNFYRNDYYDVYDDKYKGRVQNAGFGFMRKLDDASYQKARAVWKSVASKATYIDTFSDLLDETTKKLKEQGIDLTDDRDPSNPEVGYRLKADRSCEIKGFLTQRNQFSSTCDTVSGNSGGPYFWNNVLYGSVSGGVAWFDDSAYTDHGVISKTFINELREMQSLSGQAQVPATDQKICVIDNERYVDGDTYQVGTYNCSKYNHRYNLGLDLSHTLNCDCVCHDNKMTCKPKRCWYDGKVEKCKENQSVNNNPSTASPSATDSKSCAVGDKKYNNGQTFSVDTVACSKYNSALNLTNVQTCKCACNNGEVASCEIEKCKESEGYKLKDGKCVSEQQPAQTPTGPQSPTTNPGYCSVDGKRYNEGTSQIVLLQWCKKQNPSLDTRNASNCKCTCQNGEMNCEINGCMNGYNKINGKCVSEQEPAQTPTSPQSPTTNPGYCSVDGKRYDEGESKIVLLQWCKKQNPGLDTRNASNCKCTCQNGELDCEINDCMSGYNKTNGACVVDDSSVKDSLFKKPQLQIESNATTPGPTSGLFGQDDKNLLSNEDKRIIEEDIQTKTEVLFNEVQNVGDMTDDELFVFLSRTVELNELRKNYEEALARERSLPNRILSAASIGATGIGGMMLASGLAEQRADDAAEREMRAYLESIRCEYGDGKTVRGGETNVELPGGNDMISLYTEYAELANDLKMRKDMLGLAPGIESEVVIDKAETGLYDNVGVGVVGGGYASIARAIMNPEGDDAAAWAEQKAKSQQKTKTGGIVAGAGAVGGLVGNIAINGFDGKGWKQNENQDQNENETDENE